MSDTNFVNAETRTDAGWFNDINEVVYRLLGSSTGPGGAAPTTIAQIIANLGVPSSASLAASGGANLAGFSASNSASGTVARALVDRGICVTDAPFNADPTGVADSTAAIQAWLDTLSPTVPGDIPPGTYKFTAPLSKAGQNITIRGPGRAAQFVYAGAATTVDLITFGDGTNTQYGWDVSGFNISSSTAMTSGNALHIKLASDSFHVKDLSLGTLNGTPTLWDGVWFDQFNVVDYDGFEIAVQNDSIKMSGVSTANSTADISLDHGAIVGGNAALHIGGGVGGVYVGQVLCYGAQYNYLQDNALVTRGNREIILSDRCVLDAGKTSNLYVNETNAPSSSILVCDAFITGAGFFGGNVDNVNIHAMPYGLVSFGSGVNKSATRYGLAVDDTTCNVFFSPSVWLGYNTSYAIYASVVNGNIFTNGVQFIGNGGTVSANAVQATTWQSYTPTVHSSSGALTSYTASMRYQQEGKTVRWNCTISITNNGTGAGVIYLYVPITIKENAMAVGKATAISGKALTGWMNPGGTLVAVSDYTGAYPASTGETLVLSGTYEAA